jgi:hypothetical protein
MKCKNCGGVLFTIQVIPCCDDCDQNGAYDPESEEYIYDLEIINTKELIRSAVDEEGQCRMDTAFGAGCYMFKCVSCRRKENLACQEGF